MIIKLKHLILRQYILGSWIGGIKYQFSRTLFYQSLPNMLLLAMAAINNAQERFHWLTLPILVGIIVAFYIILVIVDHMLIQPSEIAWGNKQGYAHDNPVREDFVKLNVRLDTQDKLINERLDKIEKAIMEFKKIE